MTAQVQNWGGKVYKSDLCKPPMRFHFIYPKRCPAKFVKKNIAMFGIKFGKAYIRRFHQLKKVVASQTLCQFGNIACRRRDLHGVLLEGHPKKYLQCIETAILRIPTPLLLSRSSGMDRP